MRYVALAIVAVGVSGWFLFNQEAKPPADEKEIVEPKEKSQTDEKKGEETKGEEPELTLDQEALKSEAEKWSQETTKLRKAGKLEDAILAAEKMLAAELKLYGELHDDTVGSLQRIAKMQGELEKFEVAKKTRQRVIDIQTKRFGKEDWRVTDARVAAQETEIVSRLTHEQGDMLRRSTDLNEEVVRLWQRGHSIKAVPKAKEALKIRIEILGETHSLSGESIFNLAAQYEAIWDFSKSEPLYTPAG